MSCTTKRHGSTFSWTLFTRGTSDGSMQPRFTMRSPVSWMRPRRRRERDGRHDFMPTPGDPLVLFDATLNALNAEDWRGAAQLCDPVSLRAFKRHLLEQFAPEKPARELTIEDFLRHTPDKPRQVAEYELAQHRRRVDLRRRLEEELPGVSSVDDLQQLDPAEAFARWLDGRSVRRQVERQIADARIPHAMDGAALRRYRAAYTPLGVVFEGPRL